MNPNAFLKTFWRMELQHQIFVAMSFDARYSTRFEKIIKPAIKAISIDSKPLAAFRVDISKSGDSILTDIVDGIAHSQLVLADVSTIGKDAVTGHPFRNANVMYEVGIALSCRQSSEVLLIRDDTDPFLFDVSSVPHKRIDFTNVETAVQELTDALSERLKERDHIHDARVAMAIASLNNGETNWLKLFAEHGPGSILGPRPSLGASASIGRLLDKQLIEMVAEFESDGEPPYTGYKTTPLGYIVAKRVKNSLRKLPSVAPKEEPKVVDPDE